MTSERKIAANRSNSRTSCGPRSAAGKNRVSRNATRHGLAALVHRQPFPLAQIEQLADAICGGEQDPLLREQARTIAETTLTLQAVQAQKSALIERLRDREAVALASGDNRLIRAQARHLQSERSYRTSQCAMRWRSGAKQGSAGTCSQGRSNPTKRLPDWRLRSTADQIA